MGIPPYLTLKHCRPSAVEELYPLKMGIFPAVGIQTTPYFHKARKILRYRQWAEPNINTSSLKCVNAGKGVFLYKRSAIDIRLKWI